MEIYISDVSLERCKVGKSGFIACHWMCLLGVAYLLKIEEKQCQKLAEVTFVVVVAVAADISNGHE